MAFDWESAKPVDSQENQKNSSFDWSSARAVEDSQNSVYLPEKDRAYNMPSTVDAQEADFLTKTQFETKSPTEFFGMVALDLGKSAIKNMAKGLAAHIVSSPTETVGGLIQEYGENMGKKTPTSEALNFFLPGQRHLFKLLADHTKIDEGIAELGKKIIAKSQSTVKNLNLQKGDGKVGGFFHDVGQGVGSLFSAIGLTMVTKNLSAASAYFGFLQKSQVYQEARKAGKDSVDSSTISNLAGMAESGLEFIGNKFFFSAMAGSSRMARVSKRIASEAMQEMSQQAAEESITQSSGVRQKDIEGAVGRTLYAGVIGAVVAAPTSIAADAPINRISKLVDAQMKQDQVPNEIRPIIKKNIMKSIEGGLAQNIAQDLFSKETSPLSESPIEGKKVAEFIQEKNSQFDFLYELKAETQNNINDSKNPNDVLVPAQADNQAIQKEQAQGRLANLDSKISNIDSEINYLNKQVESDLALRKKDLKNSIKEAQANLDLRVAEGKPTQSIRSKILSLQDKLNAIEPSKKIIDKINKLSNKRDVFDEERARLVTEQKISASPKEDITIKAKVLADLGVSINKASIQSFQKGAELGRRVTEDTIKAAQSDLVNMIQKSGLEAKDKAKFLTTIKNTNDFKKLSKAIPRVNQKIANLMESSRRSQLRESIKTLLSSIKPVSQSGKPVGKFTADVQEVLETMKQAFSLKKDEARARLEANISRYEDTSQIPDASIALENAILGIVADYSGTSSDFMEQVLFELQTVKETGLLGKYLKDMARADLYHNLRQDALEAIVGDKPVSKTKIKGKLDKLQEKLSFAVHTNTGWDDVLDFLSQDDSVSRQMQSKLNKIADVFKTQNNEKQGIIDQQEKIIKMAKEAFGFESEKDLLAKFKEDSKKVNLGIFKNSAGEDVVLNISKAEARKIWMEYLDPTLEETFFHEKGNAYTPAMLDAIHDFMTTEDLDFVNAQIDFYRTYYERINETYSRIYGINLPFNPYYSPISREVSREAPSDAFLRDQGYRASVANGSLKTRISNIRPLRVQSDVDVMQRHISEMEHFINWADKMRELNAIFGDGQIRKTIEDKYGNGMTRVVDSFLQSFTQGGLNSRIALDGFANYIRIAYTQSVLAIKPALTAKQMVSMFAYAENIPTKEFANGVIDFLKNPIENAKVLNASTLLKERGQNITRDISDATKSEEFSFFRKNPSFRNMLLISTRIGDRGAILLGGWSIYRYHINQGLSHSEALEKFERATASAQQSSDISQLSMWQRGSAFTKLFTMFMSSQNQYLRKEINALRNIQKGRISGKDFAKTMAIYHFILPMLFQFVADAFKWKKDSQMRSAIMGSLNGAFILKDLIDMSIKKLTGEHIFGTVTLLDRLMQDAGKSIGDFYEFLDSPSMETFFDLVKSSAQIGGEVTGLPGKQVFDMAEGTQDILNGDFSKGTLKLTGWSPYVVEDKNKNKKKKYKSL